MVHLGLVVVIINLYKIYKGFGSLTNGIGAGGNDQTGAISGFVMDTMVLRGVKLQI
jgi:hypothetical protein